MYKNIVSLTLVLLLLGSNGRYNDTATSLLSTQTVLSISSKEVSQSNIEPELINPIISSYYKGQNYRAFKMIKKHIFKNMLESCININNYDIENPVWNYDSFTQYEILDNNMVSTNPDEDLYYCTFSSSNDKFGYVIVSYGGDGLSIVNTVETPYLYDLQTNIEDITLKLSETELDLTSAVASRVQLIDIDKNSSDEAILITDIKGNNYIYNFSKLHINSK